MFCLMFSSDQSLFNVFENTNKITIGKIVQNMHIIFDITSKMNVGFNEKNELLRTRSMDFLVLKARCDHVDNMSVYIFTLNVRIETDMDPSVTVTIYSFDRILKT